MKIPPKLRHRDNLSNLFEKFNSVIDYLREIRLIAGTGIRLKRLTGGISIESTATAFAGLSSASQQGHPFDTMIINKGTEEEPDYYVHIYNSGLPDSPYAGIVFVGDWELEVPATELQVNTNNGFFVWLSVTYVNSGSPPFTAVLSVNEYGSSPTASDTKYVTAIADGKLPNVASMVTGNISVMGRYI